MTSCPSHLDSQKPISLSLQGLLDRFELALKRESDSGDGADDDDRDEGHHDSVLHRDGATPFFT